MKMCSIVALSRTGDDIEKLKAYAEHLKKDYCAKAEVYGYEPFVVSSSQVRGMISALVPKAVCDYIKEKGLYRGGVKNG